MKNKEEESFSPINPSKVKTKTNSQIRFGMSSNEGDRYLGLNQDKIFFQKLPQSLEINIFGVFDGHSMCGEFASELAATQFPQIFGSLVEQEIQKGKGFFCSNSILQKVFETLHKLIQQSYETIPSTYQYPLQGKTALWTLQKEKNSVPFYLNKKEKRPVKFGTTACIAIFEERSKMLTVAHVGDTLCAIGKQEEQNRPNSIKAEFLTLKHNIENLNEVSRFKSNFPSTKFTSDGYLRGIHSSFGEVQLGMTKALGHKILCDNFGVSPVPDITRLEINHQIKVLIIASDGVWESCNAQEAVNFVLDYESPQEAAKELVEHAISLQKQIKNQADNTTAIVIFF